MVVQRPPFLGSKQIMEDNTPDQTEELDLNTLSDEELVE